MFAAVPRLRLRTALEDARAALEERLGRSRPRQAHQPIDFIWNRPSPLVVVRENRIQQHWHLAPTLFVNASRPLAARLPDTAIRMAPPSQAATVAPRVIRTLERRIETRVVDRTLSVVRAAVNRRRGDAPRPAAPAFASSSAASSPPLVVRTADPAARPDMIFARPPALPAVAAAPGSARSVDAATPATRSAAMSPAQAPALPLDRITSEVIRVLDARLIAWRERMGRS